MQKINAQKILQEPENPKKKKNINLFIFVEGRERERCNTQTQLASWFGLQHMSALIYFLGGNKSEKELR